MGAPLTDPRDLERPPEASAIVVEVGDGIAFDPTFASFAQRAAGAVIDTIVVAFAVAPGVVVSQIGDSVTFALVGMLLTALGFGLVVYLASTALASSGKWIGNRLTGTTVVDAVNGSRIDAGRAALRMFGRHVISPVLLAGYLVAFTDGQRRTFHDRLAQTVVIRPRREVWTTKS